MYAVVQHGGHQYRVAPGDRLVVDRLAAEVGSVVALAPVLVLGEDAGVRVGNPAVEGAQVAATVLGHRVGPKLRVFKYKPKKRYRRTRGFRAELTELRVEAVLRAGEPVPEPAAAASRPDAAESPQTARRRPGAARRRQASPPPAADGFTEV